MRFAAACTVVAAFSFASTTCLASAIPGAEVSLPIYNPTPVLPQLVDRASKPKRPRFTKRPRPHPNRPRHHPKDCTNTDIIKNGDFNKNVKGWNFLRASASAFFWVKDSKRRPSHSGAGQAYLFVNRGYSNFILSTMLPAVEYGNTITVSAWLRLDTPADLSECRFYWGDNDVRQELNTLLTTKWTKFSFETPGTGRPKELSMYMSCSSSMPISIFMDDVSAKACVPKKPNPQCQVVDGATNFLVNPGFECPDGITAWDGRSYYGYGNDNITQAVAKTGNPTHSGSGMVQMNLDGSALPDGYTGVGLYQWGIPDDLSRKFIKGSFWISVDSKRNNVTGCKLSLGTTTGYYIYEKDISYLTSKWTKFEVKEIEPTNYDNLEIAIFFCTSPTQPIFYLDDIYFGMDPDSPPAPNPTPDPEPTATPTPGSCTSTAHVQDPSFELDDGLANWILSDHSENYDTGVMTDSTSTYGPPHAGSSVMVLDFPSTNGAATLLQLLEGLCPDQTYTGTVWFYIPTNYDASVCTFNLGILGGSSDPITPSAAGIWTKVSAVFLFKDEPQNAYPYIYVSVSCANTEEVIILVDDITFGPPPVCNIVPAISDGSFETGDLSIWNPGFSQGDETAVITSAKAHLGKKSVQITFPSISNGVGFYREFATCVGDKYTFSFWYFVPKAYKGVQCYVYAYVYNTGEVLSEEVGVWEAWVMARVEWTAGTVAQHVDFGVSCGNQLKKVVVFLDDVGVSRR
ncbi:hypothetical protein K402DRAFT_457646 [Aulographum hederae CBS 113979]|uniref:CBM-cenC domain-containing protein n=1 Tax=Aulographum hederae CBS 113979 TaxID=1176131 RepID=A0A6G1GME2_9PEZI|nr:hypothetical protein K402DRAFT_457646 [Aulographum hederae CBS 113979]